MICVKIFSFYHITFILQTAGFPRGIECMERVLNCEISFQDLENSIGLCQSIHKVLKKYGNSKFSHLFIQILFFTADDSFADIFCFVLHEYNFEKMEISDGIKQHFHLVLEKYGKWFLKMCGNPEIVEFQIFLQNFGETRIESSSPRKQSSAPRICTLTLFFFVSVSWAARKSNRTRRKVPRLRYSHACVRSGERQGQNARVHEQIFGRGWEIFLCCFLFSLTETLFNVSCRCLGK